MTAPNSPRPAANAVTAPARMPGIISGSAMLKKRSRGPAPSVRAASSRPASTPSRVRRMARTISGKVITATARMVPAVVKIRWMPKTRCSQPPIGPRAPNSTSSRYPVSTGGSTSGRCTKASSRVRPGKRRRTSTQATAMATGRFQTRLQQGDLEAQAQGLPFISVEHSRKVAWRFGHRLNGVAASARRLNLEQVARIVVQQLPDALDGHIRGAKPARAA